MREEKILISTAVQRPDCQADLVRADVNILTNVNAQKIHGFMTECFLMGVHADFSTLVSHSKKINDEELHEYILNIMSEETTFNHRIVINNLTEKRIINKIRLLGEQLISGEISIDKFTVMVDSINKERGSSESSFRSVNRLTLDELDSMYRDCKYYESGLKELDKVIIGFFKGQYVTICGVPGEGKTTLLIQILHRYNSLLFSLEMKYREIVSKVFSRLCSIPSVKIETNNLDHLERKKVLEKLALNNIQETDMKIVDDNSDFNGIINSIRHAHKNGFCDIVGIDYFQLLAGLSGENRTNQLANASRMLKNTAHELDIPVISLSQFRKEAIKPNIKPNASDILGSGSIFNDSDVVLFLWNQDGKTKMSVEKGRKTGTGIIEYIDFEKRFSRFVDC